MGAFFDTPTPQAAPAPPPPPPAPPTIDAAVVKTRQEDDAFRRRQGTASNIKNTDKTAPTTMASQLLGS